CGMASPLWKTPPVEPARVRARGKPRPPRAPRDILLPSGEIEYRLQVPSRVRPAAARTRGLLHKNNTHIRNRHLAHDPDLLLLQPLLELLEQVHGARDARRGQPLDGA